VSQALGQEALNVFRDKFGRDPRWLSSAPGRVNLIGEHTDYNGGHVLPMAVDRHVVIAAGPSRRRDRHRFWSTLDSEMAEFDTARTSDWQLARWARYVAGPGAILGWEGVSLAPIEAVIVSDLPVGSGLSSSAALEVAAALAYLAATGLLERFDRPRLAQLCQKAEHKFAGVKCGIMDPYSVACAREGNAIYLDCHNLFAQQVPIPAELGVLVADSKVPRKLAEGEYNQRREDCEESARRLSAELGRRVHLAEVGHDELTRWGKPVLGERQFLRARHVVGEEHRTARAVEHLKRRELEAFGELARESHRSLAEDYQVSCEELDALVRLACEIDGVYGARLTGAGFGGCAVVFCRAADCGEIAGQLRDLYKVETGRDSMPLATRPAGGARVEEVEA
jgi:galactokinase